MSDGSCIASTSQIAGSPSIPASRRVALSRLLQLCSPMLPVGAYSYSQGLEWAIECGDVHDASTAQEWIGDALHVYQASFELPILYRLYQCWQQAHLPDQAKLSDQAKSSDKLLDSLSDVIQWDAYFQAGRDTAEALAETRQMGYSLCRLLNDLKQLPDPFMAKLNSLNQPAFPTVFAAVAELWQIEAADMLHAYAWSWLENQVSAAMKTVPLGQVAGQGILFQIGQQLPALVDQVMVMQDHHISNFAPGLSIAGSLHETQYSRLFRS